MKKRILMVSWVMGLATTGCLTWGQPNFGTERAKPISPRMP